MSSLRLFSVVVLLCFFATGCSQMEESEKDKLRSHNEISEKVFRLDEEHFFHSNEVVVRSREAYPWEPKSLAVDKKITKEYFRCLGSAQNGKKLHTKKNGERVELSDCGGMQKHGLPYRDEKEFIFPALIELLNYIQESVGHAIIITSGYRCPTHNLYCDTSKQNTTSKHQVGAEVDFYVEGFEDAPLEIVRWIMHYYTDHEELDFHSFRECRHNVKGLKCPGWYNKEIVVNIKQKNEERDFDNRHPYPYITIELRCDRDNDNKSVQYNWHEANSGYIRY